MGMVNSKPQTTTSNALCGADLARLVANYTPQDGGFMSKGGNTVKGASDNLHLVMPKQGFYYYPPMLHDVR